MIFFLVALLFVLIYLSSKNKKMGKSCKKKTCASCNRSNAIKMFGRDSCGYTVKMKKDIDDSEHSKLFKYIDVETKEGHDEFKALQVSGVPAFSHKDKIEVGAMPVPVLLKKFNIKV